MEPIYVDIHIHTSENADSLNEHYDVATLFSHIRQCSQGCDSLISLTDHNTINENAYIDALSLCGDDIHLLLGVELHVHYSKDTEAYHCHMLFKDEITSEKIKAINRLLNELYPKKVVEKKDKSIPMLNEIINKFDSFDFVLLPHGGQSHATFDKAIPAGAKFDTMMERSVYYNQFDGFTARNEKGREETDDYFKRLGISEFVNLITCSDNYDPTKYPQSKNADAEALNPTWMYAESTFDGLRLSLSERSRLVYNSHKPTSWSLNIERAFLKNENVDIDINFSYGLNVVIGGSSSGKTLLVDSLSRKLKNDSFGDSNYGRFGVQALEVVNTSGMQPHYICQNYIMKIVNDGDEHKIEDVDIIKSLFPNNRAVAVRIEKVLTEFKTILSKFVHCVQSIEIMESNLRKIPQVGSLLVLNEVKRNIFEGLLPSESLRRTISYPQDKYDSHRAILLEIKNTISQNPFVENVDESVDVILNSLLKVREYSIGEANVYEIISSSYSDYAKELRKESSEDQTKTQLFTQLLDNIKRYVALKREYVECLNKLSSFSERIDTREVVSSGHHLFISNNFVMDKERLVEVFNSLLKNNISSFQELAPSKLFESNHRKKSPKVQDYDDFIERVYTKFVESNRMVYKITTKEGYDFDSLSAGWKTSVLLDLILGYENDIAPIIIDQPEDNLATNYINEGLVQAIKRIKTKKQIIMVSHNATIPMMGDAQNIIFCENRDHKIFIRSSSLEGEINGKPALDLIASITDGGKPSIKKRVKKYNLKKYSE